MPDKVSHDLLKKAVDKSILHEEQIEAIEAASLKYYYTPEQEFDDINKKMVIDEMADHIKPGRILELGYTNSIWTESLLRNGTVDIIEGATSHIERGRIDFKDNSRVTIIHTLFEEYMPKEKYDTILMSGVIKHIPDDVAFLKKARTWLKPDGVVIATTPNSKSFHRRLGAYMGIELDPATHNKRDREVFNVHLYDRYQFRAIFLAADYEVLATKGIFLKILSTEQLMYLGQKYDILKIMKSLRELGEELQDYTWYILLVARLPQTVQG